MHAVYVHMPFCTRKCGYCDFYSVTGAEGLYAAFTNRLLAEIQAVREDFHGTVTAVYVGGGTPTVLPPAHWRVLSAAIGLHVTQGRPVEFTVEANPETVTRELVDVLAGGGVNRISIGAQSFRGQLLRVLGRRHHPEVVGRSVDLVRAAGIENVSLDLIYGIPGQEMADWLADLDTALALRPTHLSCYCLAYEPGTPLAGRVESGAVLPVGEYREAEMYEAAIDHLAAAGYEHYEISNWARRDSGGRSWRCRHNLLYWTNGNWWPLGPAACGHVAGWRWKNRPDLEAYLASGPLPPITDVEHLDLDGRIGEQLMLRLRLIEGIPLNELDGLLAAGQRSAQRAAAITRAIDAGLLQRTSTHLCLTRRGLLLADTVLRDLL